MFVCRARVQGVTDAIVKAYENVYTSTIGHMTDFGFVRGLTPSFRPMRFMGNVVTVQIPHLDSTALHKAFDLVHPGDVICVDMTNDTERACWGEMVSYMARAKKVAGAVIGGCLADYHAIQSIGIPLYSRGYSAQTTRILGLEGAINVPITIQNVAINPGDFVVADDDGIFVVNPEHAIEYAKRALQVQDAEIAMKEKIDAGISLAEISGAAKYFQKA